MIYEFFLCFFSYILQFYTCMFSIAKEQDGEIHYILYNDFLEIKHDPSKVKLKEGTMVRLECRDGEATVYGLD